MDKRQREHVYEISGLVGKGQGKKNFYTVINPVICPVIAKGLEDIREEHDGELVAGQLI